jgi:hypothetical protein
MTKTGYDAPTISNVSPVEIELRTIRSPATTNALATQVHHVRYRHAPRRAEAACSSSHVTPKRGSCTYGVPANVPAGVPSSPNRVFTSCPISRILRATSRQQNGDQTP